MISRKIMVGVSVLLGGGLDTYFDQDYSGYHKKNNPIIVENIVIWKYLAI